MRALQRLKEMAKDHTHKRYPNLPEGAVSAPKYTDKTANGLTKCIIDYIRFSGGYATRINTTGQMRQGKWVKGTTSKGTADIHACLIGVHYSIEVKIGKDRLSEYQKDTQRKVESAGGIYMIARNFEGFVDHFSHPNQ
ncbi:MAG: hypothetical protein HOK84_14205 [Bacteroidetes bacterium]|nr:hypothetical protein [Bacteroidota bacterium]MBT4412366.1 hypothetical protein [Bacteroidota bacterium]MBT5427350.1 hypothetical protein [Bacteroidota bacterium]